MDIVAMEQVSLRTAPFSAVSIIPPISVYMFLQVGESWELSTQRCSFGKLGALHKNCKGKEIPVQTYYRP
jgi:hypothetical protein